MNSAVHLSLPKENSTGTPQSDDTVNPTRPQESKRKKEDSSCRCIVVEDSRKRVKLLPTSQFMTFRAQQRDVILAEREKERLEEKAYLAEMGIESAEGEEEDDDDPYREEDEQEEAECRRILATSPRSMEFDYISISPFLQETFKTLVEPKIKALMEFVARTPRPTGDIYEVDASSELNASFSVLEEIETNISDNIKSETFFLYGNSATTDKEQLFLYLVKHTARLFNEQMTKKSGEESGKGDGTFSVMDIYQHWGSGDVLDPNDDMHGTGRARHRSQWKAKNRGLARHSTRQPTLSLVYGHSTEQEVTDSAAPEDHDSWEGLNDIVKRIHEPGCLKGNPEGQEHHLLNGTVVWTFYWTTAHYDPLYIPGHSPQPSPLPSGAASLENSMQKGDPQQQFTPLNGTSLYDNAVFREGRIHFVLLPSADANTQSDATSTELHALSVALQSLNMADGDAKASQPPPTTTTTTEVSPSSTGNGPDQRERSNSLKRPSLNSSPLKLRRESGAHETEADFQCRAAMRDSPLLSYLAAVPMTPYSAALWDGTGSACSSMATSPVSSPRRSISGACSVSESILSQRSVGMADLTGSKARERLRQSLGQITLLTCLSSSWEEYLQVRRTFQYLHRCLHRPLPPPSPEEVPLRESSPNPKIAEAVQIEPEEGVADSDDVTSVHEGKDISPNNPFECTTRCGTVDTLEASTDIPWRLPGKERSRTKSPNMADYIAQLPCNDHPPDEEAPLVDPNPPKTPSPDPEPLPVSTDADRERENDFVGRRLSRRGHSVPVYPTVPQLFANLEELKQTIQNARRPHAEEQEKEKEKDVVPPPPPVDSGTSTPTSSVRLGYRNPQLDLLFEQRQQRSEDHTDVTQQEAMNRLLEYSALVASENDALREKLTQSPYATSPSSKLLRSYLFQQSGATGAGLRSPIPESSTPLHSSPSGSPHPYFHTDAHPTKGTQLISPLANISNLSADMGCESGETGSAKKGRPGSIQSPNEWPSQTQVHGLLLRFLRLGKCLFLEPSSPSKEEEEEVQHTESLPVFKELLHTLLELYPVEDDDDVEGVEEGKENRLLGATKDAATLLQLHQRRRQIHFETEVRKASLTVVEEREKQLERQQQTITDLNEEILRLRMRLSEYEEKCAYLKESILPSIGKDVEVVKRRVHHREAIAEARRDSCETTLQSIEERLMKLRRYGVALDREATTTAAAESDIQLLPL